MIRNLKEMIKNLTRI